MWDQILQNLKWASIVFPILLIVGIIKGYMRVGSLATSEEIIRAHIRGLPIILALDLIISVGVFLLKYFQSGSVDTSLVKASTIFIWGFIVLYFMISNLASDLGRLPRDKNAISKE